MLQAIFLSIRREFDPADQVRRRLEPDLDLGRERLVERFLDRRALRRRQVKCAAHERGLGRCLEGPGETSFAFPSIARRRRMNTSPMRSSRLVRGKIRQRLSRDGEDLLLGPATDGFDSRLRASLRSASCRLALKASAAFRASSRRR